MSKEGITVHAIRIDNGEFRHWEIYRDDGRLLKRGTKSQSMNALINKLRYRTISPVNITKLVTYDGVMRPAEAAMTVGDLKREHEKKQKEQA